MSEHLTTLTLGVQGVSLEIRLAGWDADRVNYQWTLRAGWLDRSGVFSQAQPDRSAELAEAARTLLSHLAADAETADRGEEAEALLEMAEHLGER